MGQFNPFYRSNGGGGSSGGTSEVVRYSIEKSIQDSKTVFKLKQTINGVSSYVGNVITFDAADISFDSEKATTVEEALEYLLNFTEGNYNFTTFEELGINTTGKTMEQILSEVLSKSLPINTIITGQIYTSAAPDLGWNNAEAKIQITEGGVGQQIYWCSVSSIEVEPYQWNSIYYEKQSNSSIQETLGWTPTYYELPTASKDEKGGILVGDTLTIDSNGVLNINLSNIKSIEKIEFTSSTEGVLPAIEGATDTYTIYYTDGTTFTYQIQNGEKGDTGENGTDGVGIEKIEFTSSTSGDIAGIAGATDTYTITLTNNTTTTFTVYNGNNGNGHTHDNKNILDILNDNNGSLTYNGDNVYKTLPCTKDEYETLKSSGEIKEDWTYIVIDEITYECILNNNEQYKLQDFIYNGCLKEYFVYGEYNQEYQGFIFDCSNIINEDLEKRSIVRFYSYNNKILCNLTYSSGEITGENYFSFLNTESLQRISNIGSQDRNNFSVYVSGSNSENNDYCRCIQYIRPNISKLTDDSGNYVEKYLLSFNFDYYICQEKLNDSYIGTSIGERNYGGINLDLSNGEATLLIII